MDENILRLIRVAPNAARQSVFINKTAFPAATGGDKRQFFIYFRSELPGYYVWFGTETFSFKRVRILPSTSFAMEDDTEEAAPRGPNINKDCPSWLFRLGF
jgi:hypothetical protein